MKINRLVSIVIALGLACTLPAAAPDTTAVAASGLTLDSCLALARANNKELQRARLDVDKAQAVRDQARTKYFPQVSASAAGYYSLHPLVEVGADDLGNASVRDLLNTLYGNYGVALGLENTISLFQYGYTAGVTALQPVYMGGKIVAGNRLAEVGVEAAQLQTEVTERDILEQVEESYWLVVGLTEKRATVESVTLLLDTIHRTVEVAVDAGLALRTDLLQVESKQSEIRSKAIQLDNGLRLAQRALWQSMGVSPGLRSAENTPNHYTDSTVLSSVADSLNALPEAPGEGFGNSPEHRLLALQVDAAELQRRMTLADALPSVAVGAHYGYSYLQANILRDGLSSQTGNGAVFVTVSVPLTAWWETGHKLREQRVAVEQARLQQEQMGELLDLRTQQAYDRMQEAYALVAEASLRQESCRETARLMQVNYQAGMATITDLLTAQTALLQAQNDLTDARIAYRVNTRRYTDLTK